MAAVSGVTVEDFPADPAAVAVVVSAAEVPLAAASAVAGAVPAPLEEAEAEAAAPLAAAALVDPVADFPAVPAVAPLVEAGEVSPVVPVAADADNEKADNEKKEITARKSRDFLRFWIKRTGTLPAPDRDCAWSGNLQTTRRRRPPAGAP